MRHGCATARALPLFFFARRRRRAARPAVATGQAAASATMRVPPRSAPLEGWMEQNGRTGQRVVRRVEIRLRNNGLLQAGILLLEGQALAPNLSSRRGSVGLRDVIWSDTGKRVGALTLAAPEIVWVRSLDAKLALMNVLAPRDSEQLAVSVVLAGGQILSGWFPHLAGQGVSELLAVAGQFAVLRDARLPDGRRLGDVAINQHAVRSVREISRLDEQPKAAPRHGGREPLHWLIALAQQAGMSGANAVALPATAPAVSAWQALCAAARVSQDELAVCVATALKLPLATSYPSDPDLDDVLPSDLCARYGVRPLAADGRWLIVATMDPMSADAEQALAFACKRDIRFAIATPDWLGIVGPSSGAEAELDQLLAGLPAAGDDVRVEEELDGPAAGAEDVTSEPVIRLANLILRDAVRQNASDIHLEPDGTRGLIRFRVDGVLRPFMHVPGSALQRVISRYKILARLDIADRLRPQDGRARLRIDGRGFDLRLSTVPTQDAEKAVIRIGGAVQEQTLDQLDVAPAELARLRQLLACRDGIVVVTGPTGSGKTTTLYAALSELNDGTVNIMTVEDPVERALTGTTQIQVEPKRGVTFASALRAVLRQDPDIILVGEIRDLETAEIAVQAAMTGHLVLATLHTTSAVGVVDRLRDLGLDRTAIGASLRGVVAQRLARRVCTDCDAAGCTRCGGTGFRGRIPLLEVLSASVAFNEAIGHGAQRHELQRIAVAEGMRPIRAVAAERIAQGITTVAEVQRVLGDDDEPAGSTPAVTPPTSNDAAPTASAQSAPPPPQLHALAPAPRDADEPHGRRGDSVRALLQGLDRCVALRQTLDETLHYACAQLAQAYDAPLVWAATLESEVMALRARAGARAPYLSDIAPDWSDIDGAGSVVGAALRTGVPQGRHIAQAASVGSWRESARMHGVPIFLAVPMQTESGAVGVIGLHMRGMDGLDRAAGVELLHVVARVAAAVERIRRDDEASRQLAVLECAVDAMQAMDPLTRLPNSRAFHGRLAEHVRDVAAGQAAGAMLLIRLDGAETLRSTLGSTVVDGLLFELSAVLAGTLRPDDYAARLGDEEFAALLYGTHQQGARVAADRLRDAIAEHEFEVTGLRAQPTVSIGVALVDGTLPPREVMAAADAALYGARDGTENRVVLHTGAGAATDSSGDEPWARRIREALEDDEFVLHFQPVVRLGSGAVAHEDVLIRLHDEDGEPVPARAFIAHAESVGLIPEIDQWVLENVLRMLRASPGLRISMNLGAATITSPVFRRYIQRQSRRMGAVGSRIIFEVSEVAVARDLPRVREHMQRLRELGCRFALDNFGIGAESIASLGALPVDYVKLDGSLIRSIDRDAARRDVVAALTTVARALGKEVIAGWAESMQIAALLPSLGIELAQGHHFGRPTAAPRLDGAGESLLVRALRPRPERVDPGDDAGLPPPRLKLDPVVA